MFVCFRRSSPWPGLTLPGLVPCQRTTLRAAARDVAVAPSQGLGGPTVAAACRAGGARRVRCPPILVAGVGHVHGAPARARGDFITGRGHRDGAARIRGDPRVYGLVTPGMGVRGGRACRRQQAHRRARSHHATSCAHADLLGWLACGTAPRRGRRPTAATSTLACPKVTWPCTCVPRSFGSWRCSLLVCLYAC